MNKTLITTFYIFIYLLSTLNSYADTLTGKIIFNKKPPYGGVLYIKDNQSKQINADIDQKNKKFTRKLVVVSPDAEINFNNSDEFEHNVYASSLDKSAKFDVGLMPVGSTKTIKANWKEDSVVRISCKIHPKMKAYIINISSRYYQSFEFSKKIKEYEVKIENVPADLETLKFIMPKYKTLEFTLKKGADGEYELQKKGKVRGKLILTRQ